MLASKIGFTKAPLQAEIVTGQEAAFVRNHDVVSAWSWLSNAVFGNFPEVLGVLFPNHFWL